MDLDDSIQIQNTHRACAEHIINFVSNILKTLIVNLSAV